MIIYVAGKYSAPTIKERLANTNTAIDEGIKVLLKGHYPVIPHFSHYINIKLKHQLSKEWWYQMDFQVLQKCDGIVAISDSEGVRGELDYAKQHGITIYNSIDDIPDLNEPDEKIK